MVVVFFFWRVVNIYSKKYKYTFVTKQQKEEKKKKKKERTMT